MYSFYQLFIRIKESELLLEMFIENLNIEFFSIDLTASDRHLGLDHDPDQGVLRRKVGHVDPDPAAEMQDGYVGQVESDIGQGHGKEGVPGVEIVTDVGDQEIDGK